MYVPAGGREPRVFEAVETLNLFDWNLVSLVPGCAKLLAGQG